MRASTGIFKWPVSVNNRNRARLDGSPLEVTMATNSKAKKPDIGFVVADAIGWFSAADSREMAGELQGIPAARQGGELQH
jgi:hypothetical protein